MGERTAATMTASGMATSPPSRAHKGTLREAGRHPLEPTGHVAAPAIAHVVVGEGVLGTESRMLEPHVGPATWCRRQRPRDGCVQPVTIALGFIRATRP